MIEYLKNIGILYMERTDFNHESKLFIKRLMLEDDLSFVNLTKKLNDAGFKYTEASVRQKISRGRFDFAFALQILEVLDLEISIIDKNIKRSIL